MCFAHFSVDHYSEFNVANVFRPSESATLYQMAGTRLIRLIALIDAVAVFRFELLFTQIICDT